MTDNSFYDGAANRPRRGVPDDQRPEIDNSRRERLRRALRERRARQLGRDQDAAGDHQNRAHRKSFDRRIEAIVVASYRSPDSVGKHYVCGLGPDYVRRTFDLARIIHWTGRFGLADVS